ncbi:MAG: hypothetical protein IPI65_00015 [Bacteroidetes bacterium]|nr:hypothetical protein [Bacteroidota bacterium]
MAVRTICVESPLVETAYTQPMNLLRTNSIDNITGLNDLQISPNPVTTAATIEFNLTTSTDLNIEYWISQVR